MKNIWYVIGEKDDTSPFGYSQITPKGQYFTSLKEANKALRLEREQNMIYHNLHNLPKKKLVIFKRTCEVAK